MTSLSRLEKLGTVFTRVRDLMRAGVMKEMDKPLWYDVMATFPPRDEPTFKQPTSPEPLKELLYPEDKQRAKFYQTYAGQQTLDLTKHSSVKDSICNRYIQTYHDQEAKNEGMSVEDLMVATEQALAAQGINLRRRGVPRMQARKETPSQERKPELGGLAKLLQDALAKEGPQTR
ncbi:28S ribosomal protein S23, mitochondrial [Strongylocentrotus purpuratus]|uniref:Small ribosomal subunit protein mS23 n=1 Tax=Strongylocentrotus purpuratus TaxID=7668 RepID=A0A7M7LPC7_STRPU|nr:28S ribosomal protein S23, mitochondrial [Strongylocentrotus purpuratus]|eukprot:XP_003726492.1 PREDICTED: 28S ribosomal protein S23, mitochondrial [Strongylocentrotus purpuratus]